jgi:hypothetical protein
MNTKILCPESRSCSEVLWTGSEDTQSATVTVTFLTGAVYSYADVSQEDFSAIESAVSKGAAVNKLLVKKYKATKVCGPTAKESTVQS